MLAIGFDFDDTLILSEKEKADIIGEIFLKKYGVKRGVKTKYRALLGRMNREAKLKRLLKDVLNKNPTKKELKEVNALFSKGYTEKLSTCPLVACISDLKRIRKRAKFMFLLSLENKKEVIAVAKHCGIAKYFDEILGGPKSKVMNFKHVINKHGISPKESVYIGDSTGDVKKAKKLQFHFIGVNRSAKKRTLLTKLGADYTFKNLCGINPLLNQYFLS